MLQAEPPLKGQALGRLGRGVSPGIKTRDLLKKIRDIKGTFHAKMGTIKDRNSKDLTEAEEIKKRRQEYTEKLHKKRYNDLDNYNSVVNSPRARHPGV